MVPQNLVRFRISIASRVIASSGCDAQRSGASESLNPNRVVDARRVRIGGAIADYVLTADVSRNPTSNRLHLIETGGKKRRASGLLGERAQRLPKSGVGAPRLIECNGVEDGAVLRLQLVESLLKRSLARVVLSVGYNQKNLLLQRGSFVQVIDGSNESIVKGSTTSRLHALEGCSQLAYVLGIVLVEKGIFAEVDDEHAVFLLACLHQSQGCVVNFCALRQHGARVINQNAQGDGNTFLAEGGDLLQLAIFVHGKIVARQCGDQMILIIDDGGMQDDLFDFFLKDEAVVIVLGRGRILG